MRKPERHSRREPSKPLQRALRRFLRQLHLLHLPHLPHRPRRRSDSNQSYGNCAGPELEVACHQYTGDCSGGGHRFANRIFFQAKWGGTGQSLQVQPLAGSISSQHFTDSRFDFLLLGDTRCDFCKDGIHFLDEIGVRYRVIYLDKEPQSRILLDQLGAQGVPVFMSKKQYVIGFGKSTWLRRMEGTGVGASN